MIRAFLLTSATSILLLSCSDNGDRKGNPKASPSDGAVVMERAANPHKDYSDIEIFDISSQSFKSGEYFVELKIKNNGSKTINSLTGNVIGKDKDGVVRYEYTGVAFSGSTEQGVGPLRPGYIANGLVMAQAVPEEVVPPFGFSVKDASYNP